MNVALLPAKPLHLAKTRLGAVLAPGDRAAVARAMFEDVLTALLGAAHLDAVLVVTADRGLLERARAAGATGIDEREPRGLNGAVALGTDAAVVLGATAVLVVLSDIPLVESRDVDACIRRAPAEGALLVPSKEGTGTNALLRRPPSIFPTRFGGRSLARHLAAAAHRRLPRVLLQSARLGFDVDTPADLARLAASASRTFTYAELSRLGLTSVRPTA